MDEGKGFVKQLLDSCEVGSIDGLALEAALVCLLASKGILMEDNIPLSVWN